MAGGSRHSIFATVVTVCVLMLSLSYVHPSLGDTSAPSQELVPPRSGIYALQTSCQGDLGYGQQVSGSLDHPGAQCRYTFTGEAGDVAVG